MNIEARLRQLGLELPQLIQLPPEVRAPFSWVRLYGDRAYVSGQAPLNPDGTLAAPFGRVGAELSAEQGYQAARLATLSVLATLEAGPRRSRPDRGLADGLGDDQRGAGIHPHDQHHQRLLRPPAGGLRPRGGQHARSAIGMAQLPNDSPVIIAAEVAVHAR